MTRIPGASQFLNQSRLALQTGVSFESGNVLSFGTASLLDVGRGNRVPGVGLSSRARALNETFLSSNSASANQLFSLSGGGSATVESAQVQIAGLRASVPASRTIPDLRQDDGEISADSDRGSNIDTSA